ncbi:cytochrome P450 [Kitasatospora sp. NPDC057512]|uniref:cytochrome P450 n=1 Tax=Kitasatospora sp. NPDC057512 TaxID=3346154 RepID=UPI0036AAA677
MTGVRDIPWAPGRRPLVGHLAQFRSGIPTGLERLEQAGPLARVRLGPVTVYVVNDAALAHEILVEKVAVFTKGREARALRSGTSSGMLTLEGAPHDERRKIVQSAFNRQQVNACVPTVLELALDCARSWPLRTELPVDERMLHLAARIACHTLFDHDGAEDFREMGSMGAPLSQGAFLRGVLPPWCFLLPTPESLRFRHHIGWTRDALEAMYACAEPTDTGGSLLSRLKLAMRPDPTRVPLTRKEVIDEMATFWYAGTSTTASALAWAWHEMAEDASLEAAVHQEADAVFNGGAPLPENLVEALPRTGRVIAEVLRLHPPAPMLVRESKRAVELGGHTLPPGSTVVLNIQAMHRDPQVYPDPHVFDPDRWLPESAKAIPRHAYLPYGAGTHRCTGASFADMSATVALAALASCIRLLPPSPRRPVRTVLAATSRPYKLLMTAQPRTATLPAATRSQPDAGSLKH